MDDINLIDILSKCIGQTFYTTVLGYVTIDRVRPMFKNCYPIDIKYKDWSGKYVTTGLTKDGCYNYYPDTECIIFPSKEQRDWKKFEEELKQKAMI